MGMNSAKYNETFTVFSVSRGFNNSDVISNDSFNKLSMIFLFLLQNSP